LHHEWTFGGDAFFSAFFMATGFHGAHVIIGTVFLTVCLIRAMRGDFTPEKHVGFEAAAWYWHFVDVVWLFLFFAVYIWGVPAG
jgi:cytochrome c oxidase subunit 3